jgi:predicted dehydrogenase/nucleoside-diphosphate-sugar epimerase
MVTGICLVGAGNIARTHAEVLHALKLPITCVVDPNLDAARALARGAPVFATVAEALAAGGFDRAHVLSPPDLHAPLADTLLRAGKHVLLEKPLATTAADGDRLVATAAEAGVHLGVNQNFVYHPAFAALRRTVTDGALGPPRFISCIYHVPLRQLAARQFGAWMFRAPGNILLEQAVHPLSQIFALAGTPEAIDTVIGAPLEVAPGTLLVREVNATLRFANLTAQFRQMVGADFPFWQITVACDDGVAVADMFANSFSTHTRTGLLDATDIAVSALRTARQRASSAVGNFVSYARAQAGLGARKDPFYRSMLGSIAAFHDAIPTGTPYLDGDFGTALVQACETISERYFPPAPPLPAPVVRTRATADVVLLGGSGFIGTHTVRRLTDLNKTVAVMARGLRNLPAVFNHPNVQLVQGDIGNADAVAAAIGDSPVVVNLAHGGGGADYAAIERAMVGGARIVATACLDRHVKRLIHIGSIAALYLGDPNETITGATPPDPHADQRGDYARAKAVADRRLMAMHTEKNLPLVLMRPGIVVGEGTSPFHSGLGLFNNEQHCIGWNAGLNPLPFVLADDVADAIALALDADNIDGRIYNLVGDVRLTARDYIATLAKTLHRPLRYHPQTARRLWLEDMGKYTVKRAAGRQVPKPDLRDFKSRGMEAKFDCRDVATDLGWRPVGDRADFVAAAIEIHA